MDTCSLSNGLQQDALSNTELNGLVSRRKSIETQVDAVQQIVRTQRNHGTEQITQDLNGLQSDNVHRAQQVTNWVFALHLLLI